jgi:hypothetical protein
MSTLSSTLRREWRVAISLRAQPLWFRLAKWAVFLTLAVRFWRQPRFWAWVLIAVCLGLALHFLYRRKTRAWTRAWGGWNDLAAGRD